MRRSGGGMAGVRMTTSAATAAGGALTAVSELLEDPRTSTRAKSAWGKKRVCGSVGPKLSYATLYTRQLSPGRAASVLRGIHKDLASVRTAGSQRQPPAGSEMCRGRTSNMPRSRCHTISGRLRGFSQGVLSISVMLRRSIGRATIGQ